MPVPDVGGHGVQGILLARQVFHVGRADQFAIEPVSPAMVRTLNASRKFAFGGGTDARASVAAHIVESADLAAIITIDDDAFVANFPQEKVARVGNLIGATGADPALAEEAFQFVGKDGRSSVIACRTGLANVVDVWRHPTQFVELAGGHDM